MASVGGCSLFPSNFVLDHMGFNISETTVDGRNLKHNTRVWEAPRTLDYLRKFPDLTPFKGLWRLSLGLRCCCSCYCLPNKIVVNTVRILVLEKLPCAMLVSSFSQTWLSSCIWSFLAGLPFSTIPKTIFLRSDWYVKNIILNAYKIHEYRDKYASVKIPTPRVWMYLSLPKVSYGEFRLLFITDKQRNKYLFLLLW